MKSQSTANGTVLLTVIVVVAVLRLAQDLFMPLAIAILLTFLLAPIVARLRRWHINRVIAVIVSIAFALSLIGLVGAVIFTQFADLAHQLPQYELQLRQHITHLRGFLRGGITDSLNGLDRLTGQIESLTPAARVPRLRAEGADRAAAPEPVRDRARSSSGRW